MFRCLRQWSRNSNEVVQQRHKLEAQLYANTEHKWGRMPFLPPKQPASKHGRQMKKYHYCLLRRQTDERKCKLWVNSEYALLCCHMLCVVLIYLPICHIGVFSRYCCRYRWSVSPTHKVMTPVNADDILRVTDYSNSVVSMTCNSCIVIIVA